MNKNGICTCTSDVPKSAGTGYKLLQTVGEFYATLKFRAWGKRLCLGCYFETDEGDRFYLYAWRKQSGPWKDLYCPRDGGSEFEGVKDGTRWRIIMKKNKNGNVFWSTAEQL